MRGKLFCITDIIIATALLVTAVACLFIFARENGEYVQVSQDGKTVATLPLSEDTKYTVGTVTVAVKDGIAYVSESDCRDKICMRTELRKSGDCAICLPNRISITLSGTPDTDAVTY